ncbi:MAG: hypothetical protein LBT26_10280 [Clostridiales Family XIII bacterium]|nr:hypothetical protein [Clostridiales Family XIII bacterium]
MRNKYINLEPKREFDFRPPPKGVNKRAIRMMTAMLFLIAALIFAFPGNSRDTGGEPAGGEPTGGQGADAFTSEAGISAGGE